MNIISLEVFDNLPPIFTQLTIDGSTSMWKPTTIEPVTLIYVLLGIAFLVGGLIVVLSYYQRWLRYKVFENEMKSLDLDTESESALAAMVKRNTMDKPVQVLISARLFDEMAANEIVRVLASPGSAKAKQRFIDMLYSIRKKTYSSEHTNENMKLKREYASTRANTSYDSTSRLHSSPQPETYS